MNYLAHALLSGPDEELRLGNFLGDFVKGRVENFHGSGVTERLRDGIRLHRAIDHFTDTHPVVRRSKARLTPRYGLLAGIIVDLAYDHFLAKNWRAYAEQPLRDFSNTFYQLLEANRSRLPAPTHRLVDAMTQFDWLTSYADLTATERALAGLARRVPVAAGIETAGEELRAGYEAFLEDFREFFPSIAEFCRSRFDA